MHDAIHALQLFYEISGVSALLSFQSSFLRFGRKKPRTCI